MHGCRSIVTKIIIVCIQLSSFRWVGQQGRSNLIRTSKYESKKDIMDKCKQDLVSLAKMCLNAFDAGGILQHNGKQSCSLLPGQMM